MGNTFSTIQIKNHQNQSSEQFVKALTKHFEGKGLVTATEDDAQLSYRLVFSEKSDWVVLCAPEFESDTKRLLSDAEEIAKSLKTHCFSISVWDSDMLELHLFSSEKEQKDTIMAGRMPWGESPDDPATAKGNQDLWQPLLANEVSWEQFTEVLNNDYVFIEEALPELAPLLGIDEKTIVMNYDNTSNIGTTIIDLHFKEKGKKSISLNTAFKQVFGETLEPLGFKLIKSKYPYFIRLVGDEILHIITIANMWSGNPYEKAFSVIGGVATVYRQYFNFECSPNQNMNWLHGNLHYFQNSNTFENTNKYTANELYQFNYRKDNIVTVIEYAMKITREIMIPILNTVYDLNSCINYLETYCSSTMYLYDTDDFSKVRGCSFCNEGLLYVLTNNRNRFIHRMEKEINLKPGEVAKWNKQKIDICNRNFDDASLYSKALEELERRKVVNTEELKSHGFCI